MGSCNIRAICDWARENKLRINPEKTRALLIGGPTYIERLLQADSPRVKVNGIEIGYSRSAANLGVIFDSSLKWNEQINATSRRVFWGLHRLIKIRHLIPVTTRAHLINSLIMPLFDYCCLVCGDVSGVRAARLDVVMNAWGSFLMSRGMHALQLSLAGLEPPRGASACLAGFQTIHYISAPIYIQHVHIQIIPS